MAELDIKGFVTPEQQLNLDKLTETLTAKDAAKVKAEEASAAKKAALKKAFEGKFQTKDYLTGTVHDPHITERVFDAEQKVYDYIRQNDGATLSDVELFANPIVRGIASDSETLKELERQRVRGEAYVSKIPGADPVKFNEYFKKTALLSPDGTIPDDLSGIDITKDYGTYVLENAPIWNAGSIDNLITKAGLGKSKERVYTKDANKKVRESEIEIESPLHMKPVLDKSGEFTGKFEMPHVLYTDNGEIQQQEVIDETTGKPKLDAQGKPVTEPIKMLELDDYEKVMQDQGSSGYIKQKIREVELDPDSTAGQNYGRKVAFEALNASSKAKTRFSEVKGQVAAPITKINVSTGGSGSKESDYNPIYDKLMTRASALFNGSFDGKIYKFIPINKLPGDVMEAVKKAYASAEGLKPDEVTTAEFAINKLPSGELGIYAAENGLPTGNLVTTLSREQLDLGEAKTKERQPVLKKAKKVTNKKLLEELNKK